MVSLSGLPVFPLILREINALRTFCLQGTNISQLERDIGSDQFPPNEHYFGLVNVCFFAC